MGASIQTRPKHKVKLVSGMTINVLTPDEKKWFEHSRDLYLEQTKFTENTDYQDLDRLLSLELQVYRWTHWLASGVDYDDSAIDEDELQKNLKLYSDQITKLKDSMGLTKKSRDDRSKDANFAAYLTTLKARAREFGIHRERQLDKALELLNELFALLGAFDRSDAEEREKLGFTNPDEILDWIREVAQPEYEEIDAHFRQNSQRLWVRDL